MALRRSRSAAPRGTSRSNAARATSRWSVLTATPTSSSRSSSLESAASRTPRCIDRRATAPIAFCDSRRSRADRLTDSLRARRATSPMSRVSDNPVSAASPASGSAASTAIAFSIETASSRTCASESARAIRPIAAGSDNRATAASRTPGSASSDATASNTSWASLSRLSTAEARTDGSSCCQPGWPRNRSSRLMGQCGPVQFPVRRGDGPAVIGGDATGQRQGELCILGAKSGGRWLPAAGSGQPALDGPDASPGNSCTWI